MRKAHGTRFTFPEFQSLQTRLILWSQEQRASKPLEVSFTKCGLLQSAPSGYLSVGTRRTASVSASAKRWRNISNPKRYIYSKSELRQVNIASHYLDSTRVHGNCSQKWGLARQSWFINFGFYSRFCKIWRFYRHHCYRSLREREWSRCCASAKGISRSFSSIIFKTFSAKHMTNM